MAENSLDAGIRTVRHRLSLPVGEKGGKGRPGGYRSRREWFLKSRRLAILEGQYAYVRAEHQAGRVSIVRGGKKLFKQRHNLDAAHKTEARWRAEWETARWFLTAGHQPPVHRRLLDPKRPPGHPPWIRCGPVA